MWLILLPILFLLASCPISSHAEIVADLQCLGGARGQFTLQASSITAKVSVGDMGSLEITELPDPKIHIGINCTQQGNTMTAVLVFPTNRETIDVSMALNFKLVANSWEGIDAHIAFRTAGPGSQRLRGPYQKSLVWHFEPEILSAAGWIGRSRGKGIRCSCSRLIYDDDNWLEFRGLKLFPQAEKGKSPPDYDECASSNCPGFPWWAIVLIALAILIVLSIAGYLGFRYYSVRNAKLGRDVAPPAT